MARTTINNDSIVVASMSAALVYAEDDSITKDKLSSMIASSKVKAAFKRIQNFLKKTNLAAVKPYHILALFILAYTFRLLFKGSIGIPKELFDFMAKYDLVGKRGNIVKNMYVSLPIILVIFSLVSAYAEYAHKKGDLTDKQYKTLINSLNATGASITLLTVVSTPKKAFRTLHDDLMLVARQIRDFKLEVFLKKCKNAATSTDVLKSARQFLGDKVAGPIASAYSKAMDKARSVAEKIVSVFKKNPEKAAEQLSKKVEK